jgi:hypothetical protein
MTEVTFKTFDMVLGSSLITDPEAADEIACALGPLFTPRPIAEYDEDMGTVLWWKFPIEEPPYVGSPNDLGHEVVIRPGVNLHISASDTDETKDDPSVTDMITIDERRFFVGGWPGYHTHFTPIPLPREPKCAEPAE